VSPHARPSAAAAADQAGDLSGARNAQRELAGMTQDAPKIVSISAAVFEAGYDVAAPKQFVLS
jgi:hypothetical protein